MCSASDAGITLLEVLLAVVIIAVFVSLLTVSRDDVIATAINSNYLRTARMLAAEKMEEILLAQVADDQKEQSEGGSFDNFPGYTWSREDEDISLITDQDREDDPNVKEKYVKRVTVKIEYENTKGAKSQYSLTTILPYKEEKKDEGGGGGQ